MIEQFYTKSLKVACNLLKIHILSPFKGDDMTILGRVLAPLTILGRVLAPLKYKGCIEAFNKCNAEQSFFSMNLISHPQRLLALVVSFSKEMKEYWEIRSAETEG